MDAQDRLPIIDMLLHAHAADHQGPPPRAICAPFNHFPSWGPVRPWSEVFMEVMQNPPCTEPLWSPATDEELRDSTLDILRDLNIVGVLRGAPNRVNEWKKLAPERIIAGLELFGRNIKITPDSLRTLYHAGRVSVLAEVLNQYAGIAPNDPRMERNTDYNKYDH